MSKKLSLTTGVVESLSQKSLVVTVTRKEKNSLGKYITRSTKLHVHDEESRAQKGDRVCVIPCRPRSKQKTWELQSIIGSEITETKEGS